MPKKYWTEDKFVNRVIEGDCIEVMRHLPNDCIDMVLCDLPYGTTQNKWDSIVPLDELWAEYKRIVKPNGAIVLTSQGLFTAALIMNQPKLFKYKWVWEKSKPTNFLNAKKQPLRKHEDVCVFYNKQPVYNPQMTEGEPYDKGVRKNQLSGSYGDFQPVHVYIAMVNAIRLMWFISRRQKVKVRFFMQPKSLLSWDVISCVPTQIQVTSSLTIQAAAALSLLRH